MNEPSPVEIALQAMEPDAPYWHWTPAEEIPGRMIMRYGLALAAMRPDDPPPGEE